ncbi:hypothetical protein PC9H_004915 [Pleurotus ostreatus]|uniref:Carboxylic ester hydrolase n=1 Tax=Pleurotus ostreatus TaxID=5322 RepID=A0A8H6ZY44_PLEOS|nr:uncharacterized protein PC9H_004915 [Pleurotus ostreatus]KAF7432971.1 hypothetical protein PC9H_004915 [Pleurotus ostreatus]KAJ8698438.1 hypothetical protein PTI98_005146 [Pleurotus ostreatus]
MTWAQAFALLLFAAALVGRTWGAATAGDIVNLGYARYLGNRTFPNTNAFLGIPYAEPPLGERRFRAPLPLNTARVRKESRGLAIDATKYPEPCVQGTTGGGDAGGAGSEDCLKVNIYAPVGAKRGSKLPVLFYIHGGGYVFGNPRNWPFDHWIRQSPNVVIVSVYYRLDSFGFLATPEFRNPVFGDFNAGFKDQIQALAWVKTHIDAFGGDPTKVTINGESAGGSSVELHLVANVQRQLFSGAIAQSVYRTPLVTPEQQRPLFEFYSSQAGCGVGKIAQRLSCLRTASISALARAQDASGTSAFSGPFNGFHPVLDGKLFTDLPTKSIIAGRFHRVPLIVGATSNETLSGSADFRTTLPVFFPLLDNKDLDQYAKVYPESDFSNVTQRNEVITGESELICARTIMGSAFSERVNAWTYRYNQRNPTSGGVGVGHAAENWMMFLGTNTGFNGTTTFTKMSPIETSFAEELIAYWLSFVRAGNPNTFKLARSPTWPQYSKKQRNRISLQQAAGSTTISGSTIELESTKETERCAFVAGKVEHQQN